MAEEEKQKFLDKGGLSHVWLILKEKLSTKVDSTTLQELLAAITEKIPAEASATNQLADKNFVNSSIATNTAVFRGTYEGTAYLPTKEQIPDLRINDYAFVIKGDVGSNPEYDRYKYTLKDGKEQWVFEYTLNNSSFTKAQWDAINSGINQSKVQDISDNYTNIENHKSDFMNPHRVTAQQVGLGNVDNTADRDKPVSTAMQAALDLKVSSSALSKVATSGAYSDLSGKPTIPTIDASLSSTSTNGIQNKAVYTALGNKLDKSSYNVDTTLNNSSSNPIANSVVTAALANKASTGSVPTSASFTLNGSRLYLTLKNANNEAVAEPNISLASLQAEEMTNDEIEEIFEIQE